MNANVQIVGVKRVETERGLLGVMTCLDCKHQAPEEDFRRPPTSRPTILSPEVEDAGRRGRGQPLSAWLPAE